MTLALGSLLGEPKTAPVLCTHDDIVISSTNTLSLPPICSFGVNTRKSAAQNKYYGEIQVSVGYAHVSLEPVTSESLDLVMEALSSVTLPSDEDFCEANEPLSIWDSVRFKYHGSASIGFDKLIVESLYIATNRHDVPAASSVPATPNVEGGDKGKRVAPARGDIRPLLVCFTTNERCGKASSNLREGTNLFRPQHS